MPMDSAMALPLGLSKEGQYALESNQALADRVQAELGDEVEADVRPVAELKGLTIRHAVPPLDLLLGLGRLTSAMPGLHRVGAAGLPGLSALRTASRWAIIRYLWAFCDRRPDLRLSDLTDEVRSHQRTLLSESFGIALAADLIEQYVMPNPSRVVDADAVDYDPVLRVDMAALPSHKPDYFWYREEGGRLSEVIVVEVKGTTSGRTRCVKQMARGVEQVLVPARIRGVLMRRIVIGTELSGGKLRAYAVEVAEPAEVERLRAYEVLRARDPHEPVGDSALLAERFAVDVEEEDAADESFDLDQIRLHTFAGVPVSGQSLGRANDLTRRLLTQRETVEADGLRFRCETTRLAAGGQVLTVRTGVADEFLSSSDAYRTQDAEGRRAAYRQRRSGRDWAVVQGSVVESESSLAVVTAADGCMLSVSLDRS
jgi:hypothetical protein